VSIRNRVRDWLGVRDAVIKGAGKDERALAAELHTVNRQLAELRGLLHYQADNTMEALQRAGWQAGEDVAQHEALQRALRVIPGGGDVIAGPWLGEVGFELMYWIPFLNWLVEQGLDPKRLIVMSRGGAAAWYRHLTTRYVDVFDVASLGEFRERTAGKKKQYDLRRDFDAELVEQAKLRLSARNATTLHPSVMFRLFAALWRKRATLKLVDSFTSFQPLAPLEPPAAADLPSALPSNYIAAKFYFSNSFTDVSANRTFIAELLRSVCREAPVVLFSTSVRLDEHVDFQTSRHSGLYIVDPHTTPEKNLEVQSRIICGARGFIGTYGGFSYLAPFYGVPSLSFFSKRYGFEPHHLELADRVFDRLLPGGFLALHRCALDLVAPAVSGWVRRPPKLAADETEDTELQAQS
jgi:hypothetical protein